MKSIIGDPVLDFAAGELERYFLRMGCGPSESISLKTDPSLAEIYWPGKEYTAQWDDAYEIRIVEGEGSIRGTNPRSVLLGVYRFLTELGCRFIRPTEDGEVIPVCDRMDATCSIEHMAGYRHRGICIEGSVSLENVLNMIEWAPKAGFNSYFIQFRDGHTFFERWYTHENNPLLSGASYSREKSAGFIPQIVDKIKERGMLFHGVGHGWTCECIGYPSAGWHSADNDTIGEEVRSYLAKINGKREFFQGVPINTHLCYSKKEVRDRIIKEIVDYLKMHPEVDTLHFWLADNYNNFCECSECRKKSPPDQYVGLLNELDADLTREGISTKIVFLLYYELLWTPKEVQILNPDRFIMMFAPITRTYTSAYLDEIKLPDREDLHNIEFSLNATKYPSDTAENLTFLFNWQNIFKGDSFDFEYHLMWDIYRDPTQLNLAKIIYKDMAALETLGLNGNMSCQVQRAFFPNGLCMYVLGQTLMDPTVDYELLVEDYFNSAYSQDPEFAKEFLTRLSSPGIFRYIRGETEMRSPQTAELFREAGEFIEAKLPDMPKSGEFEFLKRWAEIYREVFAIMEKKASGIEAARLLDQWSMLERKIWESEPELKDVLDVYYFNLITKGCIEASW